METPDVKEGSSEVPQKSRRLGESPTLNRGLQPFPHFQHEKASSQLVPRDRNLEDPSLEPMNHLSANPDWAPGHPAGKPT